MKAVILAAGEGKRMHPLTHTRPKVMLPIANKPIVEHLLIELKKAGITEVTFVVGYHAETIRKHFGSGEKLDITIDYVTQRKQLGTAHALKLMQSFIKDRFLLTNGDILATADDIRKVMDNDTISLSLIEVQNTIGLGVVEVMNSKVTGIYEKVENPPSNLVNAGIYLITPDIFSAIDRTSKSPRGEYELTESLQILLNEDYPISWVGIDRWLDVSYPWDLITANEALITGIKSVNDGDLEENVIIKGQVSIGKGTKVLANTYIKGPTVIGENCDIGPNCYIRPSTAIGDNCHIGAFVEVKNSIVMNNTKIPHHNYIGDSVIGAGCNFGSGTKIANLRLDKKNIIINGMNTGRRKLGAIIGDEVQTGINASINVGSMIGNHAFIGPGALASGIIQPNSKIF